MAAATILENPEFQGEVILWDKNPRVGAKVIISG
jgi:predicted flavoprotein YhiN